MFALSHPSFEGYIAFLVDVVYWVVVGMVANSIVRLIGLVSGQVEARVRERKEKGGGKYS